LEIKEAEEVKSPGYRKYGDSELVGLCLRGDICAWETLIRRYRRFIWAIPIRFGFAEDEASDIFQTVCVQLLEYLPKVRDDRKIRNWLGATTAHLCLALFRLKQRESGDWEEVEEPLDPEGTLEDIKLLAEKHQCLRDTVEALPDRCRSLIELLYLDKKQPSYDEIGEKLGWPVSSIGPRRARCLDKLRLMLRRRGVDS
jgi:RNA polymerase sigma factor (sigma-70 family)